MKHFFFLPMTLMLLTPCSSQGQQESTSCNVETAFTFVSTTGQGRDHIVYETEGGALIFDAPLAINTDGAPNSYHPNGRPAGALNTVCNAVNIRVPPDYEERIDYRQCSRLIRLFNQARDAGWYGDGIPRVQWYGIASQGDREPSQYIPCIQEEGTFAGYFVSPTALVSAPSAHRCDTSRYINSLEVPAYVLPMRSEFMRHGVGLGDIGVAFNSVNQVQSVFVMGDIGPSFHLGEGTLALAWRLSNQDPIPMPNSNDVRTAHIGHDIRVLILPGDPIEAPITVDRLEAAVSNRLLAWGSTDRLRACLSRTLN